MKILCITDSARSCPSFRFRLSPFISHIIKAGFDFSYTVNYSMINLAHLKKLDADIIWLRRATLSEEQIKKINIPIVYDYDDAIYLTKKHFKETICASSVVLAGCEHLDSVAIANGAKKTVLLRTGVNVSEYNINNFDNKTIVWTGSSSTIPHLKTIYEALKKLSQEGIEVRVICNKRPDFDFNFNFVQWNNISEKRGLEGVSIGLAPLTNNPYALGKCSLKIVQYMAAGIPVVSANIGTNEKMFSTVWCKGACVSDNEFYNEIKALLEDKQKLIDYGTKNREIAEKEFDISILAPILIKEFKALC